MTVRSEVFSVGDQTSNCWEWIVCLMFVSRLFHSTSTSQKYYNTITTEDFVLNCHSVPGKHFLPKAHNLLPKHMLYYFSHILNPNKNQPQHQRALGARPGGENRQKVPITMIHNPVCIYSTTKPTRGLYSRQGISEFMWKYKIDGVCMLRPWF